MDKIPGLSDWNWCRDDPDNVGIYEEFFGKSNEEVQAMLAKNFIMRCIDLAGMPHEVFRYYVSGFMRYVESASESEDAIGFNVARLLDAIDSHFEDCPALEMQFWTENSDFIRRIGQLLTKLNVTSEVHAELFSRVKSKPATPF